MCLNYIIPSLQNIDIKDIKVFGVYADGDTIGMMKMVKIFRIKFLVIQSAEISSVLSLRRTQFVLFTTKNG